jgi:glutamate racemase
VSERPTIAIFDSGVGGLTVTRAVADALPGAKIRYLGDTARLPYGTKSANTVIRYARQAAALLLQEPADALVVACNTASSCALPALQKQWQMPVIGVVQPGAKRAVATTRTGHIGVIGTERTVSSRAYEGAIGAIDSSLVVHGLATPLLVGLAEEGWFEHPVTEAAARAYLEPWLVGERGKIDTLVLGCTHYPALAGPISRVVNELLGREVVLVDSATSIAGVLREVFGRCDGQGSVELLATDELERFSRVGGRFFPLETATMRVVEL